MHDDLGERRSLDGLRRSLADRAGEAREVGHGGRAGGRAGKPEVQERRRVLKAGVDLAWQDAPATIDDEIHPEHAAIAELSQVVAERLRLSGDLPQHGLRERAGRRVVVAAEAERQIAALRLAQDLHRRREHGRSLRADHAGRVQRVAADVLLEQPRAVGVRDAKHELGVVVASNEERAETAARERSACDVRIPEPVAGFGEGVFVDRRRVAHDRRDAEAGEDLLRAALVVQMVPELGADAQGSVAQPVGRRAAGVWQQVRARERVGQGLDDAVQVRARPLLATLVEILEAACAQPREPARDRVGVDPALGGDDRSRRPRRQRRSGHRRVGVPRTRGSTAAWTQGDRRWWGGSQGSSGRRQSAAGTQNGIEPPEPRSRSPGRSQALPT